MKYNIYIIALFIIYDSLKQFKIRNSFYLYFHEDIIINNIYKY